MWSKQSGGRGVGGWGGGLTAKEVWGYQQQRGCVCRSVPAWFPSPLGVSPPHSPCDHIGSEAEHEGADEGADLPRRSLASPLLLLQTALANADKARHNTEHDSPAISGTQLEKTTEHFPESLKGQP